MTGKRIGVFVCRCGGNISDYLDADRVASAARSEPGVVESGTFPFACSDAAQQEMAETVAGKTLDGIVIASCSPKLHLQTFRAMAKRAGLNPYLYSQVNIREQCSFAHRRDPSGATAKAIALVRSGIAQTRLGAPLSDLRIETVPRALVIGAGAAGMRAALALADMGIATFLVERSRTVGGRIGEWGPMFPDGRDGSSLVRTLLDRVRACPDITLYTGAEIVDKTGTVGDFRIRVRLSDGETVSLHVGAVIVATGFSPYLPRNGEYGYGMEGVMTLPELRAALEREEEGLRVRGRRVRTIAYIYCVGSRELACEGRPPNDYCSRCCCTAAVHTAVLLHGVDGEVNQYHLYRDMRTYGKHEPLFEEAGRLGSVFLRFREESPPTVEPADDGSFLVRVRDDLLGGEEIELPADLVVLVTGMVPPENGSLSAALKLPVGRDRFFLEIHPKLRPVDTVIDGIFLAGAARGPATLPESVGSSMAAVSRVGALLLKGYVDLSPLVARVREEECSWCGECAAACPYEGAIVKTGTGSKEIAAVNPALCKGCGGCVPACPAKAVELLGATHGQMIAMIDALVQETV